MRALTFAGMVTILQKSIPAEMLVTKALPGVAPCAAEDWLRVDDAYAAQMAYRTDLLAQKREAVLWMDPSALPAAREVLDTILGVLPSFGFEVGARVRCPDGRVVVPDWDQPLLTVGHLIQQDVCVMDKRGAEHVLTGAVLCFPANWLLAEKAGRPLIGIHDRVEEYDTGLARRVQRLFDGVQVGRPLWRFNRLPYGDPDLHQPQRQDGDLPKQFIRSERQTILRLPQTRAVVFAIHTFVVPIGQGGPEPHLTQQSA